MWIHKDIYKKKEKKEMRDITYLIYLIYYGKDGFLSIDMIITSRNNILNTSDTG